MSKNLSQIAKSKKIKYFLISFVDLFGVLRSKLVPAHAINEMQKNCKFKKISNAGLKESHVHDVTITREAPNYRPS